MKRFPLDESPATSRILDDNLFVTNDTPNPLPGRPVLRNLEDGAVVAYLWPSRDYVRPTRRAQAYRYLVGGSLDYPFHVNVWGKSGFNNDEPNNDEPSMPVEKSAVYEYLHRLDLEHDCGAMIVAANSLFTCGGKRRSDGICDVIVEERNLDTNALTRTWTAKTRSHMSSMSSTLYVTPEFLALATGQSGGVQVYDRNTSSSEPVRVLSHKGANRYAVSGHYLVSLAVDGFKVWTCTPVISYNRLIVPRLPRAGTVGLAWDLRVARLQWRTKSAYSSGACKINFLSRLLAQSPERLVWM